MQSIPLYRCLVSEQVKTAALRALESNQFILGGECLAFESELAAHTGVRHAVLGTSWTMNAYLLHLAQGLKPGDEVIVPSLASFPMIEPLLHCGATPVFADIDETLCLDAAEVAALVTPRTVGIVAVHLYGHPANLGPLLELAAQRGLWVIEDCAQAQGAQYKGKTVGSLGHFGVFSFFPSQNLTVLGDGGCVVTNDTVVADKLRMLRDHGRREKYLHEFAGFDLRFSELHAAIGRVMLAQLDACNVNRRMIADRYQRLLKGLVATPLERPWARSVYHRYVIRCPRRDDLQQFLHDRGIESGVHYPVPNHLQPAVTSRFPGLRPLPRTEAAVKEILSLPIHGEMTLEEADRVCSSVAAFHGRK